MMCRLTFITFFCLLLAISTLAQSPVFEIYNYRHGLSQNSITSILEDSEGYMWFGTRDGLNRFDGYDFTVYEHKINDSTSLSYNKVRAIYEDKTGTLWIGTQNGLNVFNRPTQTFTTYVHKNGDPASISDNDVVCIYEDRKGTVWIGTKSGLNKFDKETKTFTLYQHVPNHWDAWNNNIINAIEEDNSGNLWVGTTKGLSSFDRNTCTFTRYEYLNESPGLNQNNRVVAIHADKYGFLWIGTMGNGLKRINLTNYETTTFKKEVNNNNTINNNAVLCINEDSFDNIWIGTQYGGLNKYNRGSGTFEHFMNNPYNSTSLSDNTVMSVYEDSAKRLWIGTHANGINKLDKMSIKFTHYKNEITNSNSLNDNMIGALYEDNKGNVWIGNRKGLNKLNKATNTFTHYMYSSQLPGELSKNTASSIVEDKNGILWISLEGSGIIKFNPQTEQFNNFLHNPKDLNSLCYNDVNSLHIDSAGMLWIGTLNGLDRLDPATGKFTHYKPKFTGQNPMYRIQDIYEDKNGLLWLATSSHGLNSFDKKSTFIKYTSHNAKYPINNVVNNIYESSTGTLWLTSDHGGLYAYDRKSNTFHTINQPEILSRIVINAMLEDKRGNLWLSTLKNGVCRYIVGTDSVRFYDMDDGLQSNEFFGAAFRNSQGEMYFGGTNGFNVFSPEQIEDSDFAPKTVITGFKVFDLPRKFENNKIELSHKDNFFSFDFVGLSYTQPKKNKYAYKLENFDKNWFYTDTRRYASYTNLDPGTYVFHVKSANSDGVWNKQTTSFEVIITPPYWATWWFRGVVIISLLTLGYVTYTARVKSIKAQNEKLEKLVLQRTEELKQKSLIISQQRDELQTKNSQLEQALSEAEKQQAEAVSHRLKAEEANKFKTELLGIAAHDLKNPIGCFMLYSDLIRDSTQDPAKVTRLAKVIKTTSQYMFTLISDLLNTVRLESGHVTLNKELQEIGVLLQEMVERNQPQAHWKQQEIELYTEPACFSLVDTGMIKEVMENLISNAIKFTPRGKKIYISVKKKDNWVITRVEDEGVGLSEHEMSKLFGVFQKLSARPTDGEGSTGLGLSIVKKLVELHEGKVWAESKGVGVGSIFTVELAALPIPASDKYFPAKNNKVKFKEKKEGLKPL